MAKTITVKIEGTTLDLDEEVCKTDASLRKALTQFYPGAANSTIERKKVDGAEVITVTKKAGGKGSDTADQLRVLKTFRATPEQINPIILLEQLTKDPPDGRTDNLLFQMLDDEQDVRSAARSLSFAEPVASTRVPKGF